MVETDLQPIGLSKPALTGPIGGSSVCPEMCICGFYSTQCNNLTHGAFLAPVRALGALSLRLHSSAVFNYGCQRPSRRSFVRGRSLRRAVLCRHGALHLLALLRIANAHLSLKLRFRNGIQILPAVWEKRTRPYSEEHGRQTLKDHLLM